MSIKPQKLLTIYWQKFSFGLKEIGMSLFFICMLIPGCVKNDSPVTALVTSTINLQTTTPKLVLTSSPSPYATSIHTQNEEETIAATLTAGANFLSTVVAATLTAAPTVTSTPVSLPENLSHSQIFGLGKIYDIEYVPNSEILAVASATGLRFYDAYTFELREIFNESVPVTNIEFNPDGTIVALSLRNHVVEIREFDNYNLIHRLESQSSGGIVALTPMAFSKDGSLLAVSLQNNSVFIYNVDKGNLLNTIEDVLIEEPEYVSASTEDRQPIYINFSADNENLFIGNAIGASEIRVVQTGEILRTQEALSWFTSLEISNSRALLAESYDNTLQIKDMNNGTLMQSFNSRIDNKSAITFSHDDALLARASITGMIEVWDVKENVLLMNLGQPNGNVGWNFVGHDVLITFNPNDSLLTVVETNGSIRTWNINTSESLYVSTEYSNTVSGIGKLEVSPDNSLLASGESGVVRIWDINSRLQKYRFEKDGKAESVVDLTFSSDSRFLAALFNDGEIRLWNVEEGTIVVPISAQINRYDKLEKVIFSEDQQNLIVKGRDGDYQEWQINTGRMLLHIDRDHSALDISEDGLILSIYESESEVQLIDFESETPLVLLKGVLGAEGGPNPLVFTIDHSLIAGLYYSTTKIWNGIDGSLQYILEAEENNSRVAYITFSPNASILALGYSTGEVSLLDVTTGRVEEIYVSKQLDSISYLTISPNNEMLFSSSRDGTVVIRELNNP